MRRAFSSPPPDALDGDALRVRRQRVGEALAPLGNDDAVAADAVVKAGGIQVVLILYAVEVEVVNGDVPAPVFVDDGEGRTVDERQAFGCERGDQPRVNAVLPAPISPNSAM